MSIEKTLEFFEIAKPNPTDKDVMAQFGADTEECTELLEAFGFSSDNDVVEGLKRVTNWAYKAHPSNVCDINKEMALDAICDKLVTAIGLARTLNMDIVGAFNEVADSNLSKFIYVGSGELSPHQLADFANECNQIELQGRYSGVRWKREDGYVVFFDENGKIVKPSTFKEPNLKPYLKGG